ncbi:hypothetical protein [Sphingomonas jaspsi]|jgi:hypothetical protein|uniref:hypothetical protein n=1 Tax=Sphingomonas jaspsi TaxID=392409 RepID=UPI0012EC7B18|nr:hypothetical protein [Sphingomonas jaspsi]
MKPIGRSRITVRMANDRPFETRTKNSMSNRVKIDVLPPVQAGLAAALRRAFHAPADDAAGEFEALLKKLA